MTKEDWETMIKFFDNTNKHVDINYELIKTITTQLNIIFEKLDILTGKIDSHDERTIGE